MNAPTRCIYCIITKAYNMCNEYIDEEEERIIFMKRVLKEISSYDNNVTAPFLNSKVMKILKEKIDVEDPFLEEKIKYNKKILSIEEDIWNIINESEDKLLAGLKYAMVGNFIDFGAMDNIDDNILNNFINDALNQKVNNQLYKNFKREVVTAKRLCYIVDNAGEIVFDKLFIKTIKKINKDINIDIVVRGKPTLNDATMEDAVEVGLNYYGNVIENGTDIPGTDINEINMETINSMDKSDLIIAKGQGNFETLFGCNKKIYYIFLCKCDMFVEKLGVKKFEGIFMNE